MVLAVEHSDRIFDKCHWQLSNSTTGILRYPSSSTALTILLRLSDVMFRNLSSVRMSIVRLFSMFFVLWYLSFFRTPFIFFFVLSSDRRLFLSGFISRRAAVSKWDARLSSILDARQVAEIHFLSGVSVLSNVLLGCILDVQVVCVVAFQEGRLWENTCGSSRR